MDFCEPALSCDAIKRDPHLGAPNIVTPNMRPWRVCSDLTQVKTMMRCEFWPARRRPHLRGGAAGLLAAVLFFGVLPRSALADDSVAPTAPGDCAVDAAMASFCIPRHTGKSPVNMAFVDGSVSYVGLRQLWQLPWSVTFTTGGPTLVPSWMKGYN